jgi:hypothetical protein
MIIDNHDSQNLPEMLAQMAAYNVRPFWLLPNSTDFLQALDKVYSTRTKRPLK